MKNRHLLSSILLIAAFFILSAVSVSADDITIYCNEEPVTGYAYYVQEGETVTLRAEYSGDAKKFYWRDGDWKVVSNELTYVTTITKSSYYSFMLEDSSGSASGMAVQIAIQNHLTIKPLKTYFEAPRGESAHLEVEVTGDDLSDLSFQWVKAIPTGESSFKPEIINGANYSYYDTPPVEGLQQYFCRVTDRYGTLLQAECWSREEGYLEIQPVSMFVFVEKGDSAHLEVEATSGDLSNVRFQWKKVSNENGSWTTETIAGATGPSYDTEPVHMRQQYTCDVTDQHGTVLSTTCYACVQNHFYTDLENERSNHGNNVELAFGEGLTMIIQVSGDDLTDVTYQWNTMQEFVVGRYSATPIPGATEDTLVIDSITEDTRYMGIATDRYGNTATETYVVTVK